MSIKHINKEINHIIPVKELQPGQVAIIVEWDGHCTGIEYIGRIVIRHRNDLVEVGNYACWTNLFISLNEYYGCNVKILQSGDSFTI